MRKVKKNLLKCTAWYKMKASSAEKLIPQKEENILEAKWIDESNLAQIVFKSYEAIRRYCTWQDISGSLHFNVYMPHLNSTATL